MMAFKKYKTELKRLVNILKCLHSLSLFHVDLAFSSSSSFYYEPHLIYFAHKMDQSIFSVVRKIMMV